MNFIINTVAKLCKLPGTPRIKPHLPLPPIPVDIVLGDAVISINASMVGLFQDEWERAVHVALFM